MKTKAGTPGTGKETAAASYRAPALEKGFDVLELLGAEPGSLTISQIAKKLDRSVQEVYRVVLSMERRGYVDRKSDDTLQLSMKLYDLVANHLPIRRLTQAARPMLDLLANRVGQVAVISVLEAHMIRVIVVALDPGAVGFRVRLGAQRPAVGTASGRVMMAFQPPTAGEQILSDLMAEGALKKAERDSLLEEFDRIRHRGFELARDETLRGITDVSFPILNAAGVAQAALTMPYLDWVENEMALADAALELRSAAAALCTEIGGQLPDTDLSALAG